MSLTYRFVDPSTVLQASGSLNILFQSQFDDLLIDGDNGEWLRVPNSGYNEPSFYQRFTDSLDADLPGAFGYRIIGDNGPNFQAAFQVSAAPATPAVGESITWRFYHKMIQSVDDNYHPFQVGKWDETIQLGSPTGSVIIQFRGATGSTYYMDFQFDAANITGTGNNFAIPAGTLTKNEWHRYEIIYTRLSTLTYSMFPRIYNEAGTLLVDPSDFVDTESSHSLADAVWTVDDADWVTQPMWGSNGLSNVVSETEQDRWAAFLCVEGSQIDLPYPQTGEN